MEEGILQLQSGLLKVVELVDELFQFAPEGGGLFLLGGELMDVLLFVVFEEFCLFGVPVFLVGVLVHGLIESVDLEFELFVFVLLFPDVLVEEFHLALVLFLQLHHLLLQLLELILFGFALLIALPHRLLVLPRQLLSLVYLDLHYL